MSGHHHHSHHGHSHHHLGSVGNLSTSKKLFIVFILNFVMAVVELFGGFYTNSTAILSDALHDFGDSMALALSWYLEKISNKKSDQVFSFGYRRFSLLAALINSVILLVGSILILSEVIPRLANPQPVHQVGMMWFAVLGLVVNGGSVLLIRTGKSMNERLVAWHLWEDVLGWLAVLIVSVVLQFTDLYILDPILSLLITVFILKNVYLSFKKVFAIFLQSTPEKLKSEDIQKIISSHNKIEKVHHIHIWSMDGEKHVLTVHVTLKSNMTVQDYQEVQSWVRRELGKYGLWHSTVEIEFPS